MNTETVETNIYSQHDAAKFAKACQSEYLQNIRIETENYSTLVVSATYIDKDSNKPDTIQVFREEDGPIAVICNSQRLWSHTGGVMRFEGEDEATAHTNKALADAQAIYDAAISLQERLIEDANAQLVASLTAHAAQFSTPEGRKLTPEEM